MEASRVNGNPGASRVESKRGVSPLVTFTAIGVALVVIGAVATTKYAPVVRRLSEGAKLVVIAGGGAIGGIAGAFFGWMLVKVDGDAATDEALDVTVNPSDSGALDATVNPSYSEAEAWLVP